MGLSVLILAFFAFILVLNQVYGVILLTFICVFIPSAVNISDKPVPTIALCIFFAYYIVRLIFVKGVFQNLLEFPIRKMVIFLLSAMIFITLLNSFAGGGKMAVEIVEKFFLGLAIWVTLRNYKDTRKFFKYLWIFFWVICFYGVVCAVTNKNPYIDYIEKQYQDPENTDLIHNYNEDSHNEYRTSRTQSVFNHPIRYGAHLAMVTPFIITLIFTSRRKKRNYYLGLLGVITLCIILSNSRSGMLEMVISSIVLFLLYKPRDRAVIILSIGVILFLGIWVSPLLSNYSDTIDSVFQILTGSTTSSVGGSSIAMRLGQLAATFGVFIKSPYYGYGFGYTGSLVLSGSVSGLLGAESFLFELMIDTGIVGMTAFTLFFIFLFSYFLRLRKKPFFKNYKYLINSVIAMIAGYLVLILATGELHTFYFFFMLIVLVLRSLYNEIKRDKFILALNNAPEAEEEPEAETNATTNE